jgi:hypothetical protein
VPRTPRVYFFFDFDDDFFDDDFFDDDFFDFEDDFFFGTFAPERRASESPMAMACLRLFTFLPELPLLSVPCLRSCIAFSTFFDAFFEYLRAIVQTSCTSACASGVRERWRLAVGSWP